MSKNLIRCIIKSPIITFANFLSPTSKNLAGYIFLTYSITGVLVILGLSGKYSLASDVAIIQGAALATFYVLSGDSRHLILTDKRSAHEILFFRLIFFFPLAVISFYISGVTGRLDESILFGLIIRRSSEWLAEVHVTEMERNNTVWNGWILQPIIFSLLIAQITLTNDLWFIWLWAISPVVSSFKFIAQAKSYKFWKIGLENIASTAIFGFTGYIQRVLIISFAGKEFSGMLFPGFAIGSFIGSIAANVAGPSLSRNGLLHSVHVTHLIVGFLIIGSLIFSITDTVTYQTVGLSIVGGAFMIAAQQSRLTHLKVNHTLELDLLFQLSLLFSIPAIYYISGAQGMLGFYFVGSLLAYFFYKGREIKISDGKLKEKLFILISLGLIVPIFFQLNGKVYNSEVIAIIDSYGNLKSLPLPFSLLACYIGLIFFGADNKADNKNAKPVILAISAMALMLLTSIIITNQGNTKILLMLQFILPFAALLLGLYTASLYRKIFAKVALYFLIIFVPMQLIFTWFEGRLALTHYMHLFSVYSHYQYVPLIITAIYAWAWVELRKTHTRFIFYLTPWMAMYVAAGNSTLALFGLVTFTFIFTFFYRKSKLIAMSPLIVLVFILGYFYINSILGAAINNRINNNSACQSSFYSLDLNTPCKPGVFQGKIFDWEGHVILWNNSTSTSTSTSTSILNQLLQIYHSRFILAKIYLTDIAKAPLSILYGHSQSIDRKIASSPHNYYLDLTYNFGILSCLPLILLALFTSIKVWKQRVNDVSLVWLLGIVLYIVIIDNNLKVTLRQPYPAILTFFLWGIILGSIKPHDNPKLTK